MKKLIFIAVAALSGCATIREHPRIAAGAVGVVVTSIALSTRKAGHSHEDVMPPFDPDCARQPEICR